MHGDRRSSELHEKRSLLILIGFLEPITTKTAAEVLYSASKVKCWQDIYLLNVEFVASLKRFMESDPSGHST
jgi:hypothetical protein